MCVLTMQLISSRASQPFDSLSRFSLFACKMCCHDNRVTFDPYLHQTSVFRTCCVSVAPAGYLGNSHIHKYFRGQCKDSERLWNPSDPTMQSDQHARETLKGSLFCHDYLHTHLQTLQDRLAYFHSWLCP